MTPLLDRDLLYVTGKGGVGKTMVAAAIALAAAGRGRRAVLCEVTAQTRLGPLLGDAEAGPGRETALDGGLHVTAIDPQAALEEWLRTQIGGALVRVLAQSRAFGYFVAAAPGARELVTITKAWELTQPRRWDRRAAGYDLVVVDAPSSGHGVGMLRTPRTFADIARVGPIRAQADRVLKLLRDPARAGYVGVAAPAEMPVGETLELERLLPEAIGRDLDAIVVNAVYPRRFSPAEMERVSAATGSGASRSACAAGAAARSRAARVREQQGQLRRLRRAARAPVVTLPFLFRPALDLRAAGELAPALAARLP
ncbi:MAG: ArsA-related P-loop ATPase [Solirubrobacteraceae bacterium]